MIPLPPIPWACLKFIIPPTAKTHNRPAYLLFSEFLLNEFQNALLTFICFAHYRSQTKWVVMGTQRHEIVRVLGKTILMPFLDMQIFQSHTF
jgi:hypothetical protein